MDGTEGGQEKSGHLLKPSKNPGKPGGSIPEGQPHSGYTDGHGDVNHSRKVGSEGDAEGQDERGYTGPSTASRSVDRAEDGVGRPLPRKSS